MKRWIISLLAACLLLPAYASHRDTLRERRRDHRVHLRYDGWERLRPTTVKYQFAGGLGVSSVGVGWDYGRHRQWETDLLVGYLPRRYAKHFRLTFTLKQNYIPWSFTFAERWTLEPFYCGIYLTTIAGDEFWGREPGRYPNAYYNFSTKVRPSVFVGQRFGMECRRGALRGASLFYELSTNELYLVSKATNRVLRMRDILRISFGARLYIFGE